MNGAFQAIFGDTNLEEYVTGVFSDELDKLGYRHQVAAGWRFNNEALRVFGRCRTILLETIETDDERIELGLGFLGSLGDGDVLVVKGSNDYAYFGELMTRLSMEVGLAGAIIDGLTRDHYFTRRAALPIFARGYTPVDIKGRGRVAAVDVPIEIDGVAVRPNDFVLGDADAVVFVPQDMMPTLAPNVLAAVKEEAEIKRRIANNESIKNILIYHKSF